jgi:hypothetical protein
VNVSERERRGDTGSEFVMYFKQVEIEVPGGAL